MTGEIFTLLGVMLGFGLSEISQWIKRYLSQKAIRKSLDSELMSILRMIPEKEDILSQAHTKLSSSEFMPTKCAHFSRYIYERVIDVAPALLSDLERDCLHVAYENLRIIDVTMDSTEERLTSISGAYSSEQAVVGYLKICQLHFN